MINNDYLLLINNIVWSLSLNIDLSFEDCFIFIGLFKSIEDYRSNRVLDRFFSLNRNHSLYSSHINLSSIWIVMHYFNLLLLMLRISLYYFTIINISHKSFRLNHPISCFVNYWEIIIRTIYFFCATFSLNSFFLNLSYLNIFWLLYSFSL